MQEPSVSCPQCGQTNVTKIHSQKAELATPDGSARASVTHFTFKCSCGMAFTHTVKGDERKKRG
jgi:hypothetical protein